MDKAALITLTLDEASATKIANDENHDLISKYFECGEEVAIQTLSLEGHDLIQLTLSGDIPEWWGSEIVNHLPWGIALTYGADSSVSNFLDAKFEDERTTIEFRNPKDFIRAADAMRKAIRKSQSVKSDTLKKLKQQLTAYGLPVMT